MKTLLLALTAFSMAAFSTASYGQTYPADTTAAQTLKAKAGQLATELNVNPFSGTISLNNSVNQLKFRYFTASNFAVRLGLNGSKVSHLSEDRNPYGTNSYYHKDERSSTTVGVNLGIEKHFTGTRRLSPYIGADLAIVKKSTEQEITEGQSVTTITGGWREYTYYQNGYSYTYNERGYVGYGVNLVTGFDFYMAKNFFFGYEMNFGFSQRNMQELEVKQSDVTSSPANNSDVKDTTFSFGPSLMNGVRIGYVF